MRISNFINSEKAINKIPPKVIPNPISIDRSPASLKEAILATIAMAIISQPTQNKMPEMIFNALFSMILCK